MSDRPASHDHVFLARRHGDSERRTWAVIALCGAMMALEIVGGLMFGSIALVADGLHMSTHAGALLLAALAYTFARRHAGDPRFTFGTGKVGDLAGFASALVLGMIAALIGYESIGRLFAPAPIDFAEAIPIACLGLAVNAASAWLLGGGHSHTHGRADADGDALAHAESAAHGDHHEHDHDHDAPRAIACAGRTLALEIIEGGAPPRFRLNTTSGAAPAAADVTIEIVRPNGARQPFAMRRQDNYLESIEEIPEPHQFMAHVRIGAEDHPVAFEERVHAEHKMERDNNMRAAIIHVIADAAVSILVIVGLSLAALFNWLWIDPLVGIVGALVIAAWSWSLIRDTGAILLDMDPDPAIAARICEIVQRDGDRVADFHLWRLGPGHLGAIVSIATRQGRGPDYYRRQLAGVSGLSHLTIEVNAG
jgi:cation diffusion facilitator family transporter